MIKANLRDSGFFTSRRKANSGRKENLPLGIFSIFKHFQDFEKLSKSITMIFI